MSKNIDITKKDTLEGLEEYCQKNKLKCYFSYNEVKMISKGYKKLKDYKHIDNKGVRREDVWVKSIAKPKKAENTPKDAPKDKDEVKDAPKEESKDK